MSGILLHPHVHFEIRGFTPHQTAGGPSHGFEVVLDPAFAARCRATPRPAISRLAARAQQVLDACFPGRSASVSAPLRFVEDSLLLHAVEVPGVNGCLLYVDGADVEALPPLGQAPSAAPRLARHHGLAYLTHNVDSPLQAYALLSLWLLWLNGAAVALPPEAAGGDAPDAH